MKGTIEFRQTDRGKWVGEFDIGDKSGYEASYVFENMDHLLCKDAFVEMLNRSLEQYFHLLNTYLVMNNHGTILD